MVLQRGRFAAIRKGFPMGERSVHAPPRDPRRGLYHGLTKRGFGYIDTRTPVIQVAHDPYGSCRWHADLGFADIRYNSITHQG